MREIAKIIFLTFLFFLQQSSFINAQENEKIATLKVAASGITKETAIRSALLSAIEQSFGTYLSSKTVVSNDNLVSEEIVSISNGNIKKYSIINENKFSDSLYSVLLLAEVSIDKLQKFIQSKGYEVEAKGGGFIMNIYQQILEEKSEIKTVDNLVSILHSLMHSAFDFKITSDQPKSLDPQNLNWQIKHTVSAVANGNMTTATNFLINNLSSIGMTANEVENYKSLNKTVYEVVVNNGTNKSSFYLRKFESILILNILSDQFNYYIRNFQLISDIGEHFGFDFIEDNRQLKSHGRLEYNDKWQTEQQIVDISYFRLTKYRYRDAWDPYSNYRIQPRDILKINFFNPFEIAANLYFTETMTLEQLGKIKNIKVITNNFSTRYKEGGFVLYESDSMYMVVSPYGVNSVNIDKGGNKTDIQLIDGNTIDLNFSCNQSILSSDVNKLVGKKIILMGYDDWKIPSQNTLIYLEKQGFSGLVAPQNKKLLGFDKKNNNVIPCEGCQGALLLTRFHYKK
jgi:hypothetical protein